MRYKDPFELLGSDDVGCFLILNVLNMSQVFNLHQHRCENLKSQVSFALHLHIASDSVLQ